MDIDVIVSAYDNAAALHHTLLGYRLQSRWPATVWVAEDGQSAAIAETVCEHRQRAPFAIRHLHQPHRGFGKWRVVNRAIAQSRAPWLVFTDADCVPRADLLAQYQRLARPGQFVAAGSHIELPLGFWESHLDGGQVLRSQQVFDPHWLRRQGVLLPGTRLLPARGRLAGLVARALDRLTPRSAFVGNNAGAWRNDLLQVAGFDETLGYGGADRNLGIRLEHLGVHGVRARHSLVCLHLGHTRPWRDPAAVARNKEWNRHLQRTPQTLPRASLLLGSAGAAASTVHEAHPRLPVGFAGAVE